MNDAVETGNDGNEEVGTVVGIPENFNKEVESKEGKNEQSKQESEIKPTEPTETKPEEIKSQLPEGQWLIKEGVLGSGDRPEYLLEKYGYNMETQAKAYPDAAKKIGEQNQRLGAFTGAPDKYDFSSVEDKDFAFDQKDPLFGQFVTECQNSNVSQDFAVKIAGLAKNMLGEPAKNLEEEAKTYGENFKQDSTNIINWVKNNNVENDAKDLMESIKSASAMRALRNLMDSNNFKVPTGNEVPTIPKETVADLKREFAANLYEGEKLSEHPEKAQEWVKKFNKFAK